MKRFLKRIVIASSRRQRGHLRLLQSLCSFVMTGSFFVFFSTATLASEPPSVFLEELTWKEVESAIQDGYTTVIIPTGGTEQNGAHLVLGKHNYIVRYTSEEIAKQLGRTLVAPVVAYTPEGDIEKKTHQMQFAGTISLSDKEFKLVLESAARSLAAHGFKTICLIGDSWDNQKPQEQVAEKLNRQWAKQAIQVIHVGDYYDAHNGQMEWLKKQGETEESIGKHAGIRDTSEMMVVFPRGVRTSLMKKSTPYEFAQTGVYGDPTKASLERGKTLLELKVVAAVNQIKKVKKL
jgi:creatinine amidohydrolase/Fe(II)-dependent formamide hydrolase-like protein